MSTACALRRPDITWRHEVGGALIAALNIAGACHVSWISPLAPVQGTWCNFSREPLLGKYRRFGELERLHSRPGY